MKKTLYLVFISILLFLTFLILGSDSALVVGDAIQQWISLILVLVLPLSITTDGRTRFLIFLPLSLVFSIVGMNWADYSDLGGIIYPMYCILILIIILISHYILKYIESKSNYIVSIFLAGLIILTSIFTFYSVKGGLEKYNDLVNSFNTKCRTIGSPYGNCNVPNYIKLFPPYHHITF